MKKILLTLFAVAAIFVACDKDGLEGDISNVNVLEQAEEINATVDISEVKDILNGLGFSGELQDRVSTEKGSASTARTNAESTAANCIDNRPDVPSGKTAIDFQFLPISGTSNGYFITRGGGDTPLLLNRPIVRFLVGTSSEDVQLQLFLFANGSYGSAVSLGSTGYSPVFPILAAADYITIDRTDLYLDSLTGDVGVSADDAGIGCSGVDYTQFYEVIPAPFPLSGFLARITGDVTGMGNGTSLNYAASSEADVRAAIENDIQN